MIDTIPGNYQALYSTQAEAEAAAAELQAQGRETRIVESILHKGQYVLYANKNSEPQP